jgi:hypothetical protein
VLRVIHCYYPSVINYSQKKEALHETDSVDYSDDGDGGGDIVRPCRLQRVRFTVTFTGTRHIPHGPGADELAAVGFGSDPAEGRHAAGHRRLLQRQQPYC